MSIQQTTRLILKHYVLICCFYLLSRNSYSDIHLPSLCVLCLLVFLLLSLVYYSTYGRVGVIKLIAAVCNTVAQAKFPSRDNKVYLI